MKKFNPDMFKNAMSDMIDFLIEEIGLSVDGDGLLFDYEQETYIYQNGSPMILPKYVISSWSKNTPVFNPFMNPKQMRNIFSYFCQKLLIMEERSATILYTVVDAPGVEHAEVKVTEPDGTMSVYRSGQFIQESVRYLDLIIKINGNEAIDLYQFDADLTRYRESQMKTARKRTSK